MVPSSLRYLFGSILLLLMTMVVYLPTYAPIHPNHTVAGFVWDDDELLVNNSNVRSIEGVKRAWLDPRNHNRFYPDYYPLTYTSWWLEVSNAGMLPQVFHVDNVILHAINAILVWTILARLGVPGAFLAGAIFAVHPVEVESVAWISERKNVLSGAFFLLSAWAFIEAWGLGVPRPDDEGSAVKTLPPPPPQRCDPGLLALSLILFVLAMFAKPVTMTLAGVLPLILWLRRRRLGWRELLAAVPYLILALPMAVLTMWFQRHHIASRSIELQSYTLVERCLIAGRALCFYAGKLFWPAELSFAYHRWDINARQGWAWLYPLACVAVLAVLWRFARRLGVGPLVGVLFFAITLSPALGFVPILWHRYYFVADHVQYLASIGLIAVIAAAAARLVRGWEFAARPFAYAAACVVLASLAAQSFGQSSLYLNAATLWSDVLSKDPESWMANNNLGVIAGSQPAPDSALALARFQRAAQINPRAHEPHANMGMYYASNGMTDEAIAQDKEAVRLRPTLTATRVHLGKELAKERRLDEAVEQFRQVIRFDAQPDRPPDPALSEAHYNLGLIGVMQGQDQAAFEELHAALQDDPALADAHLRLGDLLHKRGEDTEATDEYIQAMFGGARSAQGCEAIGEELARRGDWFGAVNQFRMAIELDAKLVAPYLQLGKMREQASHFNSAVDAYQHALALNPDDPEIKESLRRATEARNRSGASTQPSTQPAFPPARVPHNIIMPFLGPPRPGPRDHDR